MKGKSGSVERSACSSSWSATSKIETLAYSGARVMGGIDDHDAFRQALAIATNHAVTLADARLAPEHAFLPSA